MDVEIQDAPSRSLVKASLRLGSEVYTITAKNGTTLSDQLISMKEASMSVLKEYIVKHNAPIDVPDELVEEESSEDEVEAEDAKSKKTKIV